jgi:hypothetical protein
VGHKRYFRGDSADYYEPLLKYLATEKITFSISADMSPELRALAIRQALGRKSPKRTGT